MSIHLLHFLIPISLKAVQQSLPIQLLADIAMHRLGMPGNPARMKQSEFMQSQYNVLPNVSKYVALGKHFSPRIVNKTMTVKKNSVFKVEQERHT